MKKTNQPNKLLTSGVCKVPVVMQLEATECGAASLAMVAAYFGKWLPLEQTRQDCAVSRDGSSAKNIVLAARSYGFKTSAFRAEADDVLREGPFPCIIHWGFNHFVVLDGAKKDEVYLNDPARGAVKVTRQEFDEKFTGIMIVLEPGEDFEPSGKPKSVWAFARQRLQGTSTAMTFVVLTTIISSLLSIIEPAFSRVFLDQLLTGSAAADYVRGFFILLCVFSIVRIMIAWLHRIYSTKIEGKMAAVGNASYLWKVLHLPMHFFSQRLASDIANRQASNAGIAGTLINTLAPLVLDAGMMAFYLVVMVRYNWVLAIVGVTSVVLNLFMSRYISDRRTNIMRVQARDNGKLSSSTVNGIGMVETLKACGAEDGYFEKWSGLQASVNAQNVAYTRVNQYLGIIPALCASLSRILILGLGVHLVLQGQFTIGMVMAFQGIVGSFYAPAMSMIAAGQTIQEMTTQMERVDDVMNYPDDVVFSAQDRDSDTTGKLSGRLEMKNVTFGYAKLAAPLLKDFSLTLEPGKKVAFVGPSGCGKSTLAKLISGLYQPWSGEILFDGKPITEIDRKRFTGSVAVVDQDINMFEGTVGDNVKMWNKSIEDFEMILAARDACIHEDVMERDGGFDHHLLEDGKDFSGGQRQRLEIARALAQEPTILIMDEATSALDAKTEYDVVKRITDRGITCVVIAHRLSTIRDCDEIIVLNKGQVVERGTHDELYANGGLYKELVCSE